MSPISKTAQRPKNTAYPKKLNSLGDHIRKRRLDLDLEQKDVGKIIKTDKQTIWNWENNKSKPEIKYYPAIMDFLGYCPYVGPQSWGDKLKFHRIYQGLTIKQVSKIVCSDPTSVARWEKRKEPPVWKTQREKVERFMTRSSILRK